MTKYQDLYKRDDPHPPATVNGVCRKCGRQGALNIDRVCLNPVKCKEKKY